MRCVLLLLLLVLLHRSGAQSVLLKQITPDYDLCHEKPAVGEQTFFCLVPANKVEPAITGAHAVLIPLMGQRVKFGPDTPPDFGVLIRPLAKDKWLLVLDCTAGQQQQLDREYGCQLFLANPSGRSSVESKIVAGCSSADGLVMTGSSNTLGFAYNLRAAESYFTATAIRCVGILTEQNIVTTLNTAKVGTPPETAILWISKLVIGGVTESRALSAQADSSSGATAIDFEATKKLMDCDYDKLKPARSHSSLTHNLKEVNTLSKTIKCPMGVDLLMKTATTSWSTVEKITCEGFMLYSHKADGTRTEVVNEAVVACGERAKCIAPPPLLPCENCFPTQGCGPTPGKCDQAKCTSDEWRYNGGLLHRSTEGAHCRKESVEDVAGTHWYLKIGWTFVRLDNASCGFTNLCWTKYPMVTSIDWRGRRDNTHLATLLPTRVRCPPNHNLRLQHGDQDRTIAGGLLCDKRTANWKTADGNEQLNLTRGEKTKVYCEYNESADNVLLGGAALTTTEEEDDKWYEEHEIYLWYACGVALLIEFLIVLAVKLNDFNKAWKIRRDKKRTEDYNKRTPEEKFKMRPWQNSKDGTKRIDEEALYNFNLLSKKVNVKKYLCPGMWKDFALYAHEEQMFFLEALLSEFSKSSRLIKKVIPLLYKVTEKFEEGDMYKRPLHSKVVKTAFNILKILAVAFGKRGDREADSRIRRCLGVRASNILQYLGYDRVKDEDKDNIPMRMHCLDALFFAGHEETEKKLLEIWAAKRADVDTPLRKYVWAAVVRTEPGGARTIEKMLEEDVKKKAKGRYKPGDVEWGDVFEHYIYAICASHERSEAEKFFNGILKDQSYKAAHVCAGFHAMLEVFDYNHVTARFLFQERHSYIREKVEPITPEYAHMLQLITQYTIYWPNKETWLWKFYTGEGNFTMEQKQVLEKQFMTGTIYSELYARVYKDRSIVDTIECWLSEGDYAAEGAVEPEKSDECPVWEPVVRKDASGSKKKGGGKDESGKKDPYWERLAMYKRKDDEERARRKKAAQAKEETENEGRIPKLAGTQEPESAPQSEPGNGEQKTQDSFTV